MGKRVLTCLIIGILGLLPAAWSEKANVTGSPTALEAGNTASLHNLSASYQNYVGRKYRLGPNDVMNISVYDTPEFDRENVAVQPDGKIVVAPLGSLAVAGMTIEELHDQLVDRFKSYLNDPQVSITLVRTKPFTVYVSGAVAHPGGYEIITDATRQQTASSQLPEVLLERKSPLLSNILVAAGGVSYDADLEHVKVTNRFDNSTFEINVLDLINEGASQRDLYLVAGDSVSVPRLATPGAVSEETYKQVLGSTIFQRTVPVKVYGYVNRPGLLQLESAQSANLNSAIAAAGGYLTDSAYAPNKVYLSRMEAHGVLRTTILDPTRQDVTLMPNDIVYVPEKGRPLIGKAFDYMGRLITPVGAVASAYNNWALMFNPTRFQINLRNVAN